MNAISVLICDDHALVREGLRVLLKGAEGIEVAGEVANGRQAVSEAKRLLPDVVLLDVSMPQLNGMEAARQIAREVPSTKVLILSAHTDEQCVQRAIEAGAGGYLMKGACASDLLPAIRATARGNAFFCPAVPKRLLKQWRDKSLQVCPNGTNAAVLSTRQTEVLQLIAEGYASKQIAGLLSINFKTVEKHRQRIMTSLHLPNIAMLTRYAVSTGVVECHRGLHLAGKGTAAHSRLGVGHARAM